MNRKKVLITLGIVLAIILIVASGTYAYWTWTTSSSERTNVVFTTTQDFSCAANGGGNITSSDVTLAPASCTNSEYAIKRTVTVTPTINRDDLTISMDLWLDVNSISTGLSESTNFKYALTTSSTSCTDGVLAYGNFNELSSGSKVDLLNQWEYSSSDPQTYYLYIWLHNAEKDVSTTEQSFDLSLGGSCTDEKQPEVYAVYSADDSSLRFYKTLDTITEGSTYNDLTATAVYEVDENGSYSSPSDVPWKDNRTNITQVVIESQINPISTAYWFAGLTKAEKIIMEKGRISKMVDMSNMFERFGMDAETSDNTLQMNFSGMDTSNVMNMSNLLKNAGSTSSMLYWSNTDLFNTSNVINMSSMFEAATMVLSPDAIKLIRQMDTSNVVNMSGMFAAVLLDSFSLNLNTFNTSMVTDMSGMFAEAGYNSSKLSITGLENWDTSNVTNMSYMFTNGIGNYGAGYNATNNWSLDLSGWNVSKVTAYGNFKNSNETRINSPVWVN